MSFWNLFRKDPKDLFLEFSPIGSNWRVVTWNFDLKDHKERRWTVEVHGKREQTIIWSRKKQDEIFFFQDKAMKKGTRGNEKFHKDLMNLSIHATLKYSVESNHDFMLTPVPGATTLDIENENKALLWIQASFHTLNFALDNLEKDKTTILTAACFSGLTPDTDEEVLRIIIFNLDIFYYLRDDKSLQVVIFDDKNMGHGNSKTPRFQQIIKIAKPQFYDEITKLLKRVAQVGEIN